MDDKYPDILLNLSLLRQQTLVRVCEAKMSFCSVDPKQKNSFWTLEFVDTPLYNDINRYFDDFGKKFVDNNVWSGLGEK